MRAKIRKRPYTYKGKTEDRWLVLWADLKGTRREKWFRTRRHADGHAAKIDQELADRIHVADGVKITFAEACKAWLKQEEGRADSSNRNANLTKGSLVAKVSVAKNHLLPFFGSTKLSNIDSPMIKRFVEDQAHKFEHWTARRHKAMLKQVLDFAVENDLLRVSPLTLRPVRIPGTTPRRSRGDIPEVEDVTKLLDTVLNRPRPREFSRNAWSSAQVQMVLGALMGLRPGEIGGLQWENVKLDKWTLDVEHSLSFYDGLKAPKNESSRRMLDLEPVTHRVLQEHAKRTIDGTLGRSEGPRRLTGYVLTTTQNGRVMPTTLRWRHHNILKLAGLVDADGHSNFSPHALRHFAGSLWLAEGMTLKDVSWRLGHKNTKMTENVYLHQLRHDTRAKQVLDRVAARCFPGISGSPLRVASPIMIENDTADVIDLKPTTVTALPSPSPSELPPANENRPLSETPIRFGRWGNKVMPPVTPMPPKIQRLPRVSPEGYTASPSGRHRVNLEDAPQWLDDAIDMLEKGSGIVEIARRLQRGESTITRWLKAAGIADPGKYAATVRIAMLEAQFAALTAQGYQVLDIAERTGASTTMVKRWRGGGRTPGGRPKTGGKFEKPKRP